MLSVLIPIYNYNVHPLVSELQAQLIDSQIDYEIILADDASSDESMRHHNAQLTKLDNIKLIQLEKNVGRSKIRNMLADAAQYPTLLLMDCDARVKRRDYIANYLRFMEAKQLENVNFVVLGGLSYRTDEEKSDTLRYKYGIKREIRPASERERQPYRAFTPFNMLISKSVFQTCRFDESLRHYGYEDTFFGIELEQAGIPVFHIDNELYHDGIDTNTEFLNKVAAGVSNLVKLHDNNKLDENFKDKSPLMTMYEKLEKGFFGKLILSLLSKGHNWIRNIALDSNSLFFLDLYKLSVLHGLLHKKNSPSKENLEQ